MYFEIIDRLRRARGRALVAAGFGPDRAPHRTVLDHRYFRLSAYGGTGGEAGAEAEAEARPVLCIPATIKQAYIWDLQPDASVMRRLREAGFQPYLIEWRDVAEGEGGGLELYADALPLLAADAIAAECGGDRPILAGHSLGGTFAAIFAARHPDRAAGLVLLEAPLRFGERTGALRPLTGRGADLPAGRMAPGSLLSASSALAAPDEFVWPAMADRLRSAADPAARSRHWRVVRWSLDEFAMPGPLFGDVMDMLYRGDRFAQGTLAISGQPPVGAADLTLPLLFVVDPGGRVVPPDSAVPDTLPPEDRAPRLILEIDGRKEPGVPLPHVAALVGAGANATLWPRIADWMREVLARQE